jgi:hypothetical protein
MEKELRFGHMGLRHPAECILNNAETANRFDNIANALGVVKC